MGAKLVAVPVEEYLHTVYRPDCDYVDGELVDRNVGEKTHGDTQRDLLLFLAQRRREIGIYVGIEIRMRVSATRYRVPDLCVFVGEAPDEQVFTHPPFLCIEILSPEDRVSRMEEKVRDYLSFGVRYIWVIDPRGHRAWIYTPAGRTEVTDGVLRTENPEILVPLAEILG
jgi:Uma2 family endonuclease